MDKGDGEDEEERTKLESRRPGMVGRFDRPRTVYFELGHADADRQGMGDVSAQSPGFLPRHHLDPDMLCFSCVYLILCPPPPSPPVDFSVPSASCPCVKRLVLFFAVRYLVRPSLFRGRREE